MPFSWIVSQNTSLFFESSTWGFTLYLILIESSTLLDSVEVSLLMKKWGKYRKCNVHYRATALQDFCTMTGNASQHLLLIIIWGAKKLCPRFNTFFQFLFLNIVFENMPIMTMDIIATACHIALLSQFLTSCLFFIFSPTYCTCTSKIHWNFLWGTPLLSLFSWKKYTTHFGQYLDSIEMVPVYP